MPTLLRVHQYFDMGVEVVTYTSQAVCRHKNAILGQTPGNEHKSSTVFGTSESNQSLNINVLCLMYLPRDELNNTMNNDRGTGTYPALSSPKSDPTNGLCNIFFLCFQNGIQCKMPTEEGAQVLDRCGSNLSLVWELRMRETNVVKR